MFSDHYRHSAPMVSDTTCTQNSSNRPISIFCLKLLVHHCVSCAVRKKKPHGCTKSESFLKNLPSVIRERCVNCKQFEITEKVFFFFPFGRLLQNVFTDKVLDLTVMLASSVFPNVNGRKLLPTLMFFSES